MRKEGEWLKEKDETHGATPLHWALVNSAPEAVVVALAAAWPDAAKEKNNGGCTPLHFALLNNAPGPVVVALVAACPDAAKAQNE